MINLRSYGLLVNDVFYRGYHILDFIDNNPNMSDLDKEAISATIMDALVYKSLINPNKQSLDLDNLCICNDLQHYCYNKVPFVVGIPLSIKEKMREKAFIISGSVPASVFFSKPSGNVHYCIYDMNTAFSAFFDDFTFLVCDYSSPTREGVIAQDRPFVEVLINDQNYLVDALTKRIFRSDLFKEKYNMVIKNSVSKKDFDDSQKELYNDHTTESVNYATFLLLIESFNFDKNSGLAEYLYEIEKSKEYFSEEFDAIEQIRRDMVDLGFSLVKK